MDDVTRVAQQAIDRIEQAAQRIDDHAWCASCVMPAMAPSRERGRSLQGGV
jgi:hypothetical protein